MKTFIIRRLLTIIPMLLGITLVVFLLLYLAPGNFLDTARQQQDIPTEYIQQMEKDFGLDKPWFVQYFLWLKNVVSFDFGYSWTYRIPVAELLTQRLAASFALALCITLFEWAIAIPLGVLAAIYKDSFFDRLAAVLAYAALSMPEFFLALFAV